MTPVLELLQYVLRYFPNTVGATLFVVGIATGKMAWVLTAIGGLVVAILTLTLQYVLNKTLDIGAMPGAAVIEACSILPVAKGAYATIPSLWITLTTFFATFIFVNAMNVYKTTPAKVSRDATAVQQRKGVGLISMLAAVLLLVFMALPRAFGACENTIGIVTGLALGIFMGIGWWTILNACGPDVFPDIHGVMIGLKPGALRTNPMACKA